ncbi:hypothetical protein [Luteibacter aegosomatissinici]|uniref:hypothetical protein n=1 Tax=Luteibacter aegosomatissinici TaxID=2911539 RepID=UPI001FFA44E9|nr:hypothetical protein [Luteibacter aegosomatissinici]UPG92713.1 hypothetical protein L2Y97_12640 [Luteibacter aegosomatissinici]
MDWATLVHGVIAVIALGTGLVSCSRLATHRPGGVMLRVFFAFAFLTDASAFVIGFDDVRPTHIIAIASLLLLGVTLRGFYIGHQHGTWRSIYRVGVISNTYILALMATLQLFAVNGTGPSLAHAPALFLSAQGLLGTVSLLTCVRALRPGPGRRRRIPVRSVESRT